MSGISEGRTMTAEQVVALTNMGERIRTGRETDPPQLGPLAPEKPQHQGHISPQPDKAREWNRRWEQRYAPNYVTRPEDDRRWPKPPAPKPPVPRGREPHSASVIRALERHINGGRQFSPEPQP